MSDIVIAQSKNPVFLAELYLVLNKNPVVQTANCRIEEDRIMVGNAIKKNNITYKQLQIGVDFFREGWNRHRKIYTNKNNVR